MKQTPIQELTVLVHEVIEKAQSREVKRVFKLLEIILAILEETEAEFARECFDAGVYHGIDRSACKIDGMPIQQPDFDKWFKQYSKQKK